MEACKRRFNKTKATQLRSSARATIVPWSQLIESHLDNQDLWEVVQGKDQKPERLTTTSTAQASDQTAEAAETATAAGIEEYDAKLEAWTKKAKKARMMNISIISPSVMTYVEGTKDSAEEILEGRYKPKTRVTLRQLQRQSNTDGRRW
jgi:hypothetical protein